jgi:hypothetical protein
MTWWWHFADLKLRERRNRTPNIAASKAACRRAAQVQDEKDATTVLYPRFQGKTIAFNFAPIPTSSTLHSTML